MYVVSDMEQNGTDRVKLTRFGKYNLTETTSFSPHNKMKSFKVSYLLFRSSRAHTYVVMHVDDLCLYSTIFFVFLKPNKLVQKSPMLCSLSSGE
jgi:hypothetical protein